MMDFTATTDRLRTLGSRKPTPEARKEVQEAIESKWEGIQSVAISVLGQWGGRESVETLRQLLPRAYANKHGWAIRGVLFKALNECYESQDVSWILDLYFSVQGVLLKHEMFWPLVVGLPVSLCKDRLLSECSSQDRDNRQAAMKAIANMKESFPGRDDILRKFSTDPDPEIRKGAIRLLRKQQDAA